MKLEVKRPINAKWRTAAALIAAVLAVWRMPTALGLAADSGILATHAVSVVILVGLFLLFRRALDCRDARLARCACVVGALLALFVVIGESLKQTGELPQMSVVAALTGIGDWLVFTAVASAALLIVYQGALSLTAKPLPEGKESLFSRISGNGFVVFGLLLLCWLPVWLAFYPGTFAWDSLTQYLEYYNNDMSPHHPLLHTLMIGGMFDVAYELALEGYPSAGVALYSVVQMVLLAAMLGYCCHWLRRKKAPLWARVCVTLFFAVFPFVPIWSFCAQKDVLFSGLLTVLMTQLVDFWQDGPAALRKPLRLIAFAVNAILMMLMRNNGLYALCLLLPFVLVWAKGARVRATILLAVCVAGYLLGNAGLIWYCDASESDAAVEMLSIPLQQLARAATEDDEAIPDDAREYMQSLYPNGFTEFYAPYIADPVKWSMDSDELELGKLLSIWLRTGATHPQAYIEAFCIQNLPYYLPGAVMQYNFDLGVRQSEDLEEIEVNSYLPELKELYKKYDSTLRVFNLPGTRLLSDTAFYVWVALAAFGLAVYRREKHWLIALCLLLAIWLTCLLGPVAIMRYMLCFFYGVPLLVAAMLTPRGAAPKSDAMPDVLPDAK